MSNVTHLWAIFLGTFIGLLPIINPLAESPNNLKPGKQNDGVHRVQSDYPLGVLVYGFDSFVSYAYAGGTELVDTGAN